VFSALLQHRHEFSSACAPRRQAEEPDGISMRVYASRGRAQHVLGRPLLDHATVLHHDDAMRTSATTPKSCVNEQDAGVAALAQAP